MILHHLNVNVDAGWETKICQSFNDLRIRIQDVNQTLVHPHLELFAGIFKDEGRKIRGSRIDQALRRISFQLLLSFMAKTP